MKEVFFYLWRRKVRTLLTMLAIVVGIFAVTAVGGINGALQAEIRSVENDALQRIQIYTKDYSLIPDSTVRHVRRIEGVAGVIESIYGDLKKPEEQAVRISINPEMFIAQRADDPALTFEHPVSGTSLHAGRLPQLSSRTETAITWAMAQKRDLSIGDTLMIREHAFEVVGIWEDVPTDAPAAIISYPAGEELLPNPYRQVSIVPNGDADPEAVAERVEAEFSEINAMSPAEAVKQARQQVLIFSLVVGASGIISLLIGTFTIVNTMIVSVQERRQEIGLKKALGAEDRHILREIILEAVLIAGIGGILGMSCGAIAGNLFNTWVVSKIGSRLFMLSPWLAGGVILFSIFMGVIGGLYPAWRASRVDPVIALRGGENATYAEKGIKRLIYLIRRNGRAILTVVGIAIGIFTLVLLGSLAEAVNGYMREVSNGMRNLLIVYPDRGGVPYGETTARLLRDHPGVHDVIRGMDEEIPTAFHDHPDDGGETKEIGVVARESRTGDWGLTRPVETELAEGRMFTPDSTDEVVLGPDLVKTHQVGVGDTIYIDKQPFKIVGVWRKIPFDVAGNDTSAYISMRAMERLLGPNTLGMLSIRTTSPQTEAELREWIPLALPGMKIESATEILGQVQSVFGSLLAAMGGIFAISVFVGGVSVANTMIIAVNEKVPEIGLKKAVGADDLDVLAEVLLSAARLGATGALIGIGLATLGVLIINPLVSAQAGIEILTLSPSLLIGSLVFGVVLGMISGAFPARRAAQLDPVVALHAE